MIKMSIDQSIKQNVPNKTKLTLTPSLRFPEFSGEWEEKRLGDYFNITSSKRVFQSEWRNEGVPFYRAREIVKLAENGFVNNTLYISEPMFREYKKKYGAPKPGDLLITGVGTLGRVYLVKDNSPIYFKDGNIIWLRTLHTINSFFVTTLFELREVRKQIIDNASLSTVGTFTIDTAKKLKVSVPCKEEQQKIASFLTTVDDWIENLKKQKEAQEKYKKGMMQKIFSQEIRFRNENRENYPEWEEKRLGELGSIYNGLTGKSGEDFGVGEPFITYKQIFDNSELDTTKFSLVSVSQHEKQNTAQFGDIFFTTSSETPNEVGFSSVLLKRDINPFLNSFSFGFRPRSNLSPYFAKYLFRCPLYRKKIGRLAQGSTRYNISKVSFAKEFLEIPSFDEQHKIAGFLTLIEDLINLSNQRITLAEEWKKGLMQRMFV